MSTTRRIRHSRPPTAHPGREGVGRPPRHQGRERRARPRLHRPAPRPRGDQPPGLRRPPAAGRPVRRPDLTIATEDHNTPTLDDRQADRRSHQPHPDRDAASQRRGVRHPPALARRQGAGHRPRRRPAARPDDARHHRRVRRQPHAARTARSARWRSGSARARSSTCWRPRRCRSSRSRRWRSPSRASCGRASPRRTSSWPSSPRSAPAAGRATCSSTAAAPSGRSRWRAG